MHGALLSENSTLSQYFSQDHSVLWVGSWEELSTYPRYVIIVYQSEEMDISRQTALGIVHMWSWTSMIKRTKYNEWEGWARNSKDEEEIAKLCWMSLNQKISHTLSNVLQQFQCSKGAYTTSAFYTPPPTLVSPHCARNVIGHSVKDITQQGKCELCWIATKQQCGMRRWGYAFPLPLNGCGQLRQTKTSTLLLIGERMQH